MNRERLTVISALGVVQILAWGTSFYLLAVLAGPIGRETGWSAGEVTAGMSLGLLVSAFAARPVGRLIQRRGGRTVMAAGMLLLAVGLAGVGLAGSYPAYVASWLVIGLGMAGSLYDAAFSTLGRAYGRDARSAITVLTLWGGFASTVCWPISALLVENIGWRNACLAFALAHIVITLPLCWFCLPRVLPGTTGPAPAPTPQGEDPAGGSRLRFWCIAVAGVFLSAIASMWSVHLITVMIAQGHTLASAVALGALIGPAQVGGRVAEMMGRGRHHPIWTMLAATTLVLAGFAGLGFGAPAGAALVAYGAGNGLWSIARGALPLAIFGPDDYATVMGRLATPMLLASAAAPTLGGLLLEGLGAQGMLMALFAASAVPCVAALLLRFDLARR